MRIPLSYLLDSLQKSFSLHSNGILRCDALMSRPRFLQANMPVENNRLYIASLDVARRAADQLPASSAILTVSDANDSIHGTAVFGGTTPETLINLVQDIFDRCESWDDALRTAAASGEMRELLDEIEAMMGNPILLRKSNYAIVACSSEVFSNPDLAPLRGTHLPYEQVNALKRDPLFNHYRDAKTPFFLPAHVTGMRSLSVNLFLDDEASYRLSAIPILTPLSESAAFLLGLCVEYVTQVLRSSFIAGRQADPSGRRERLVDLLKTGLDNENADFIVLEQGFVSLGWLPTHEYCCLAIKIASLDYLNHTVELLCNQLEGLLPGACVFEHNDCIAAFINLSRMGTTVEQAMQKCVYFLRDNDLRTGISNTFSAFYELRNYYKQAHIALDFASRPQAFQWIQYFADVVLDYILEQSNRELPLHFICSEKILNIKRYDQEHQTDFYATLECYIKNKFNAVQTAKELFIHRSTFLYRMDRLQTLFGLDLTERDSLLYVLLSMKMLELSKSMMLRE